MDRTEHIIALFVAGSTLTSIGDAYGMSKQRVHQILRAAGVDSAIGGLAVRRDMRLQREQNERDDRYLLATGMKYEEFKTFRGSESYKRFTQQRTTAHQRGIEWELNFAQWWRAWQESGHWNVRGRGKGYCMARKGDKGPYALGNIYFCTIGQNSKDSYLHTPWLARFPNSGSRGYHAYFDKKANKFRACVYKNGRRSLYKTFNTLDEAEQYGRKIAGQHALPN